MVACMMGTSLTCHCHFYKCTMEFKSMSSKYWPFPNPTCFCPNLIDIHGWQMRTNLELHLLDGRLVWLIFNWKVIINFWFWGGSMWNSDSMLYRSLFMCLSQYQSNTILGYRVFARKGKTHFSFELCEISNQPLAWRVLSSELPYKQSIKKYEGRGCRIKSDQDFLRC